eukprot:TRINITY_DN694_c0_g2_i1.p1 TRINITY_DN694_c0_g2~~TRINITY_DN694_c0_g2_i1.p1  ORF type:complete len:122 (+),score=20.13 TRINITY_DN694_c0_g2_i1:245-610(+)
MARGNKRKGGSTEKVVEPPKAADSKRNKGKTRESNLSVNGGGPSAQPLLSSEQRLCLEGIRVLIENCDMFYVLQQLDERSLTDGLRGSAFLFFLVSLLSSAASCSAKLAQPSFGVFPSSLD